jgi:hypothetical protein
MSVMKAHRGITVCRAGRQIDVADGQCPWFTFINYDRNWGVEIDFPPVFDEEFHITTSKQQVVLSSRMWDILKEAGVRAAISDLKKRFNELRALAKKKAEDSKEGRPSEKAMTDAEKFKTGPQTSTKEQQERSEESLQKEVERRSEETGVPEEEIRKRLEIEVASRPYRLAEERSPGASFFRVDQTGGQRRLYLNTAHRFYTDVYAGPDSSPRLRASLEILLFVIGDAELESEGDRRSFYQSERAYWSQRLEVALDQLDRQDSVEDELSAEEAVREEKESYEAAAAQEVAEGADAATVAQR